MQSHGWGPDYDRQGRSGARETVIIKQLTATMALRAACSGIPNKRLHTHTRAESLKLEAIVSYHPSTLRSGKIVEDDVRWTSEINGLIYDFQCRDDER